MRASALLFSFAFLASACTTARPTQLSVPTDLGPECARHCSTLGMRLSAVVIIMNASGCVCEPKEAAIRPAGASAAAGGAAIQTAAAAQQQQQGTTMSPSHAGATQPGSIGGR
jgi:hypothetical protein